MKDSTALTPSITLLSEPEAQEGDAAEMPYQHILQRIEQAQHSVEVYMYVWRADAVGHLIGQALYAAAERGVRVKILKDSGAALFESQEDNKKSFFVISKGFRQRVIQRGIGMTFPRSFVQDDWNQGLGEKLRSHPNVEFSWVAPTHTKYYCIDESYLITGSLNLEVRHRKYHDVMVEVSGERVVEYFRKCQSEPESDHCGMVLDDGQIQMLFNDPSKNVFLIKSKVMELIESAVSNIHIEMAYLGDEDVTRALIYAGNRGVEISILMSNKANIGNDINYHVLRHLMQKTKIQVRLSSKMIHSKVMVVDQEKALLGSANFSVFSMQRAGEFCLFVEGWGSLMNPLNEVLGVRWQLGRSVDRVSDLPHYWQTLAWLQQWHQRTNKHQ